MTPQRPVGCVVEVRYSVRTPAASLRSRRSLAYLSSPTQPMKMVALGGSMYYEFGDDQPLLISEEG